MADHQNPLETWDDAECYSYLRFDRDSTMWIVDCFAATLQRTTRRSYALPPLLIIIVALHQLASGAFYNVVRRMIGVSSSTGCRVLWEFIAAVVARRNDLIKWPTTDHEIKQAKIGFFQLARKY